METSFDRESDSSESFHEAHLLSNPDADLGKDDEGADGKEDEHDVGDGGDDVVGEHEDGVNESGVNDVGQDGEQSERRKEKSFHS